MLENTLNLLNTWKCIAETTLSGNYGNAYCYAVPPEVQDALATLAQYVALWLGW